MNRAPKRIHLILLVSLGFFLLSCAQPAKVPPLPVKDVPTAEKADLGCSYFYYLWGSNAEYFERFDEALEAYDKALICDPDVEYVRKKIPLVLIKQGEIDKAVAWLQQAITETPRDISLYLLLAHIKIQEKKGDEAVQLYTEALKFDPGNQTVRLRLGFLYTEQKKYRLAEIIFRDLLKTDNTLYPAHLYLARLLIQIGDFIGAGKEFELALSLNWSQELAYEIADFYNKHEKYEQALRLFNTILESDDADERAALGLVQTLLVMGREQEAIDELTRLQGLSETPDEIDLIISKVLLRSGKIDKAKGLLEKIAAEQDSSEANYMLALIYFQEKKSEKSIRYLEKITAEDTEFQEAVYLQTRILRDTGNHAKAFGLLKRIISDPSQRRPLFYALLASLYEEKDERDKALNLLKTGIDLFPDNEQLHFERALLLEKQGKQDEAIQSMEKVLELFPDHPEALNYIGYTWADRNMKLDTALQYIKKAVALKPDNGYIRDSLGWVYYRLGRLEEARIELEKALESEPDDPNVHDHLGDVYRSLHNTEKAREAYQQSLKLLTDPDKKKSVEKKIDELNGKSQ